MPIGTVETPVRISTKPEQYSQILPERNNFGQDQLKNEFNNQDDVLLLRPLESFGNRLAKTKTWDSRKEWEEKTKKVLGEDFEYYSRTKDLEIDTDRTKILQNIVDKMLEGETDETRVVIMRRSGEAQAFVCPDGTIFVSQPLLNNLDTLDEVAAVLAHELSHLKYQTSFTVARSRELDRFGIEWIHEGACDQRTKNLLENAGFNSLAFSSMIEKIAGFESRSTQHQGGLARASQSVGAHFFLDSRTSHIEQTRIEGEYKILHAKPQKTNLEIAMNRIKPADPAELKDILEKLHPRDLESVYLPMYPDRKLDFNKLKTANEVLMSRLETQGYSKAEAVLFVISFGDYLINNTYLINTPESFQSAIDNLEKIGTLRWSNIYKDVFGSLPKEVKSPATSILWILRHNMNLNPDQEWGIPVTEQTLLDALEKISKLDPRYFNNHEPTEDIGSVFVKYINKAFVKKDWRTGLETTDTEKVRAFLEEVKRRKISFDPAIFYRESKYGSINKAVLDILQQVFDVHFNETEFDSYKHIDDFFEIFKGSGISTERTTSVFNFLKTLREQLNKNNVDNEKRQELVDHIDQKINGLKLDSSLDLYEYLDSTYAAGSYLYRPKGAEEEARNERLTKFNLRLIMAMGVYREDGEEFYSFLEKVFNELSIDPKSLSQTALINLCQPLFAAQEGSHMLMYIYRPDWLLHNPNDSYSVLSGTHIKDYDRFTKLPFIKAVFDKSSQFNFQNFEELNKGIQNMLPKLHFYQFADPEKIENYNLFDDKLVNLIFGQGFLENTRRILEQGIGPEDYAQLYEFVEKYYPAGSKKDEILRELNKQYLNSPDVSLDEKTFYLLRFFEQVGPEGMVIVANQIGDIETYRKFRGRMERKFQEYLEGGGIVTKVAAGDFITSKLTKNFKDLIETCKEDSLDQREISTKMATYWFEYALRNIDPDRPDIVGYDTGQNKFVLGTITRESFKSLADIFSTFRNLSPLHRFAMAHKALTDVGGALTNTENRGVLADTLIASLRLKKGFISSVIRAACLRGDPKFISFPATNLLSSLLFRAFSLDAIDINKVANFQVGFTKEREVLTVEGVIPKSDIKRVLTSDTRDISVFGAQYKNSPQSMAADLAKQSDQLYFEITSTLEQNLRLNRIDPKAAESEKGKNEIDPTIEAVIKGVEATGALGIRSLQLATQFQRFSPAIERRLADSFDANPGLNKLLFWENLNKLAGENPEIEDFVKSIILKQYLGGGSLQTTYSATYTDEGGRQREVIVKMKNPNVEAFIKQAYTISHNVLEFVSQDKSVSGATGYAGIGMLLTDLAQNWCLDDINDKTFEQEDDLFRQTVTNFNQSVGRKQFFTPDRVFTTSKVKSETLANGKTVNQILNDNNIDQQTKSRIINSISRFFAYQIKKGAFTDEEGEKFYLIHSDPHVGNYVVDTSDANSAVGVIDRSLYLRLKEADIKVLDKMVTASNSSDFVWSFVNRIMDINKTRGIERVKVQARVIGNIAKEFAYQISHGGVNKTLLLRSILAELSKEKMDVPLNLRLMIRNIGAFQELGRRYGVDFESLYRKAAA